MDEGTLREKSFVFFSPLALVRIGASEITASAEKKFLEHLLLAMCWTKNKKNSKATNTPWLLSVCTSVVVFRMGWWKGGADVGVKIGGRFLFGLVAEHAPDFDDEARGVKKTP